MEMKPINDFPGYFITNEGQVISYKFTKPRIMKTWLQKSGYENIKLCKENQTYHFLIHRLVAEHFIPNPNNLPQVNHKNKIRNDNRVENLEWCSITDNLRDSYETMSPKRNFTICSLYGPDNKKIGDFGSISEAAIYAHEIYGISKSGLQKYWKSKGFYIQEV